MGLTTMKCSIGNGRGPRPPARTLREALRPHRLCSNEWSRARLHPSNRNIRKPGAAGLHQHPTAPATPQRTQSPRHGQSGSCNVKISEEGQHVQSHHHGDPLGGTRVFFQRWPRWHQPSGFRGRDRRESEICTWGGDEGRLGGVFETESLICAKVERVCHWFFSWSLWTEEDMTWTSKSIGRRFYGGMRAGLWHGIAP